MHEGQSHICWSSHAERAIAVGQSLPAHRLPVCPSVISGMCPLSPPSFLSEGALIKS